VQGDRGYDSAVVRFLLRWLGVFRRFVERAIAWLHAFGRLRRRLDRLTELQEAFLRLGCSLICLRFLNT
jgi:hypothetical protein